MLQPIRAQLFRNLFQQTFSPILQKTGNGSPNKARLDLKRFPDQRSGPARVRGTGARDPAGGLSAWLEDQADP